MAMTGEQAVAKGTGRIAALDVARSVALLGMAVFHLTFDLQMFGLVAPGTVQGTVWSGFAKLVAGSFLFLAGVSLWLAHGDGIRWHAFARRLAVLVAAAAAISVATWFAMPESFIYFGILHSIALASVIGVLVLRLPVFALLALAAGAVVAPDLLASETFDRPALWWTGLAVAPRPSMDFEPVLPWVAPCLAGVAVAKRAGQLGLWDRLAARRAGPHWLGWPGRHSLAVYLVHQPVLIVLVWAVARIVR